MNKRGPRGGQPTPRTWAATDLVNFLVDFLRVVSRERARLNRAWKNPTEIQPEIPRNIHIDQTKYPQPKQKIHKMGRHMSNALSSLPRELERHHIFHVPRRRTDRKPEKHHQQGSRTDVINHNGAPQCVAENPSPNSLCRRFYKTITSAMASQLQPASRKRTTRRCSERGRDFGWAMTLRSGILMKLETWSELWCATEIAPCASGATKC